MKKKLLRFAEWLEVRKLSNKTIAEYIKYCIKFLTILDEGKKPSQAKVNSFILQNNNGVARAFLKNYFEFKNIKDLEVPKITGRKPKKIRKFLTPKNYKLLRKYLYQRFPNHMSGIACDLAYSCGLRREEVENIRIKDFDWEGWSEDQEQPCKLKIHGKGNKERYVMVNPKLMTIILNYTANRELENKFVITNPHTWKKHFERACKRILKESYSLHDLRRARATIWHKNGIDLFNISKRLGHADISTTMLYVNPQEEEMLEEWKEEFSGK